MSRKSPQDGWVMFGIHLKPWKLAAPALLPWGSPSSGSASPADTRPLAAPASPRAPQWRARAPGRSSKVKLGDREIYGDWWWLMLTYGDLWWFIGIWWDLHSHLWWFIVTSPARVWWFRHPWWFHRERCDVMFMVIWSIKHGNVTKPSLVGGLNPSEKY